jgi:hypothetical protein
VRSGFKPVTAFKNTTPFLEPFLIFREKTTWCFIMGIHRLWLFLSWIASKIMKTPFAFYKICIPSLAIERDDAIVLFRFDRDGKITEH